MSVKSVIFVYCHLYKGDIYVNIPTTTKLSSAISLVLVSLDWNFRSLISKRIVPLISLIYELIWAFKMLQDFGQTLYIVKKVRRDNLHKEDIFAMWFWLGLTSYQLRLLFFLIGRLLYNIISSRLKFSVVKDVIFFIKTSSFLSICHLI